ncbi:hypothetical protein C8R45DRAFT_1002577 [Mycena sanguinolenta]|nr:hypothetical protein C8R45DRAFT_1002577 [Mycena sanguinolenta]
MYAFQLALLALSATAAYAYPVSPKNPDALALVQPEHNLSRTIQDPRVKSDEKRQIHNADYQANGPPSSPNPGPAQDPSSPSPASPAPSEPAPKAKRSDSASWRGSSLRSLENADTEVDVDKSSVADRNEKRQIRNADYQVDPSPAQESSSPANPPAASPSSSAAQDKRTDSSFEDSTVPYSSGSHVDADDVSLKRSMSDTFGTDGFNLPASELVSLADDDGDSSGAHEHESSIPLEKRSISDTFGPSVFAHCGPKLEVVSPFADDDYLYGERRRTVEELTNVHNRNINHEAVIRWSRAEVERMQAWSKLGRSNMD